MKTIKLEICEGVAGEAVYLNDCRIAGPRHNGIMRTTRTWTVRLDDLALAAAVRSTETRSRLSPKGRQSGPTGNAQKPIP